MIDFGQDLGPPGISFEAMACQDEASGFPAGKIQKSRNTSCSECRKQAVARFLQALLC